MIALWIIGTIFLALCTLCVFACCIVSGMSEEQDEKAYEEFIRQETEAKEELKNID